jgi:hypothetical protein
MPEDNEGRFYWLLDKDRPPGRHRRHPGRRHPLGGPGDRQRAEEYAHNNIKKHEQLPLKLGMLNPIYFLMYCTGEKINITQIEGQFPQAPSPNGSTGKSSSRTGSRFRTTSSSSIFWTGSRAARIPSPTTPPRK